MIIDIPDSHVIWRYIKPKHMNYITGPPFLPTQDLFIPREDEYDLSAYYLCNSYASIDVAKELVKKEEKKKKGLNFNKNKGRLYVEKAFKIKRAIETVGYLNAEIHYDTMKDKAYIRWKDCGENEHMDTKVASSIHKSITEKNILNIP